MMGMAMAMLMPGCAPTTGRRAGHGRVVTARFHSEALGVEKNYLAWLPPGYDEGAQRYPVVYLLHGLGGDETDWIRKGHADAAAERVALAAILVMPDGDAGFWADAASDDAGRYQACVTGAASARMFESPDEFCVRRAHYEHYVVEDLVRHIDGTFRTRAVPSARAIGGLSMGGFGALMLAMRHHELFVAAASHSGVDSLLYEGPHPFVAGRARLVDDVRGWGGETQIGALVRGVFGPDRARWQAHDPAWLASQQGAEAPALYLDCGDEDHYQLDDSQRHLDEALTAAGVPHQATIIPGGRHDFALWQRQIDRSLGFFKETFSRAK